MQRSISARWMVGGLLIAAVLIGSVLVSAAPQPARVARYGPNRPPWHRYFGPLSGTYGATSFAVPNQYFYAYAPPVYAGMGYGYGSVGGYGYWPPYPGGMYAGGYAPMPLYMNPYANPVLRDSIIENQVRWGSALPLAAAAPRVHARIRVSSPGQKAKSIHAEAQGDVWMRKLMFLNAYERYKYANQLASDRSEPYFRLAFASAAVGSFDSAVQWVKQGLEFDPAWPAHGERLNTLFGSDNRLAVLSLIERITQWVREDIRDPDRLFLMGVILHFDGDNRASQFFEAAYRLAGSGDHLLAFLQPAAQRPVQNPNGQFQRPATGTAPPAAMEPPDPAAGAAAGPPIGPVIFPGQNPADGPNGNPQFQPQFGQPPSDTAQPAPQFGLPPLPQTTVPNNSDRRVLVPQIPGPQVMNPPNSVPLTVVPQVTVPRNTAPRANGSNQVRPNPGPATAAPLVTVPSRSPAQVIAKPRPAAPQGIAPRALPIVPPSPAPANPESDADSESSSTQNGAPASGPVLLAPTSNDAAATTP
jgi:hypothetical protein